MEAKIVRVDYVDYGVQGEGIPWFGKTVASSDVDGMTVAEISKEISEMLMLVGEHCSPILVEEVAALA